MKMIVLGLLKALGSVLGKMIIAMASEKFVAWLLFWVGDIVVKSTKTTHDDKFLEKLKEAYESKEGEPVE